MRMPHPAHFALHKLVVLSRRTDRAELAKDKETAMRVLEALIDKRQEEAIRKAFSAMPRKWQNKVKKQLSDLLDKRVLEILTGST